VFSAVKMTPEGEVIYDAEWERKKDEWLPTKADGDYIASLMKPCWEPGRYAGWIAPPRVGIDNKPGDFEYVQLHMA
jgi:benzoyl-CoA 2,3-epoxidase subunit B